MEIRCRNVSHGLQLGLGYLISSGVKEPSRNGAVLAAPEPVTITYQFPQERVLRSAARNANPFFHFMESLWMLAGRNDLSFPLTFNSKFGAYSDDANTLNGAYGFRWRKHFELDQLEAAVEMLRADPTTRRCVVSMWDPAYDLLSKSKDIPCNTHIYLDARGGVLNMTVCNRSNDVLWGAFGANAVHMSVLQEFVALRLGLPLGFYRQFTNNLHLYTDILSKEAAMRMIMDLHDTDMALADEPVIAVPIIGTPIAVWLQDLSAFMSGTLTHTFADPIFSDVAVPMYQAWVNRRTKMGQQFAETIKDSEWRGACTEWLARNIKEQ